MSGGRAEVRATVNERRLFPTGFMDIAEIGERALMEDAQDRLERLLRFAFEHLDLLLRRLQLLLAEAGELEPALVRGERFLEGKVARFHARNDFFQLGERLLEVELGAVA